MPRGHTSDASAERNPYAPPEAAITEAPSSTALKRRSVLLMIALTVVTLGLYYPVWFFRRRPGINQLNSPRKLPLWPLVVYALYLTLSLIIDLAGGGRRAGAVIGDPAATILLLARLPVGLLMLWQTFTIRSIIEDHLRPDDSGQQLFAERVQLSGIKTFFFGIFYLQHAINTHIAGPRAA